MYIIDSFIIVFSIHTCIIIGQVLCNKTVENEHSVFIITGIAYQSTYMLCMLGMILLDRTIGLTKILHL